MSAPLAPLAVHEFAHALREGASRLALGRGDIARGVRVTPRTVSRWSMGQILPHEMQHDRLLALFAPAGRDIVDRMRHALALEPLPAPPPAQPAPPPRPKRDPALVAKDVELALLAAAESLDCSPRLARAVALALLEKLEAVGVSPGEARAMLAASGAHGTSALAE